MSSIFHLSFFINPKSPTSNFNLSIHIKHSTVPVRKKGITSILLSSFANKHENNKIERLTFDSNCRNAKMNVNNEFYIGKVFLIFSCL